MRHVMVIPNATLIMHLDPLVQNPWTTDRNQVLGVAGPLEHVMLIDRQDGYLGQALLAILGAQVALWKLGAGADEGQRQSLVEQIEAIQRRIEPYLDERYSEAATAGQLRAKQGAAA